MIIRSKPDYQFNEGDINFRVFYIEKKVVVKAKCLPHMVIQYSDNLSDAIDKSKIRMNNLKNCSK